MSGSQIHPALVIGVSGATWSALWPLVKAGRTPNINRLMDRGCCATLTSVKAAGDEHYRPQVAWPSIATGCLPERHGVTKFYHEAAELREPALWDFYNRSGLSAGIYGWPGTWPPKPVNGFIVPSHLARDARTWPPTLSEIKALDREQQSSERQGGGVTRRLAASASSARTLLKHGLRASTLIRLGRAAPSMILGSLEQRRLLLRRAKLAASADIFVRLQRRHQLSLSAFVTFFVDFVSHRYWRYRDPQLFHALPSEEQERLASAVDDAYIAVDRVVGQLVASVGDLAVIALVSEHGMAPEPNSTELGPWYYSIRGERVRELAGLDDSIGTCPIARWVAFRPVEGRLSAAVAARLRNIRVVDTGLALFRVYQHGEEVVIKLALDPEVPRYAMGELESLKVQIGGRIVAFDEIARKFGRQRSAMHTESGIFAMAGPHIRRGVWLSTASVVDVAPTLLKASGVTCNARFDGRILEIFES